MLAPAVERFPPTRQFPELAEAQTLLAALSESDAVKSAAALRQRRIHLQISLGNALIWAKGYTAPETSAAFARARELAHPSHRRSMRRRLGVGQARAKAALVSGAVYPLVQISALPRLIWR